MCTLSGVAMVGDFCLGTPPSIKNTIMSRRCAIVVGRESDLVYTYAMPHTVHIESFNIVLCRIIQNIEITQMIYLSNIST